MSARERENGLLKMSELAERSGVSAATIKHYLREGLLPEPVRTSRNMAYYPPDFVERIQLIKRLQEDRFMPLRLIKQVVEEDPERARKATEACSEEDSSPAAVVRRVSSRVERARLGRGLVVQGLVDLEEEARAVLMSVVASA